MASLSSDYHFTLYMPQHTPQSIMYLSFPYSYKKRNSNLKLKKNMVYLSLPDLDLGLRLTIVKFKLHTTTLLCYRP